MKDSRGLGITIAGYVEKAAGLFGLLLDHREMFVHMKSTVKKADLKP